MTAFNVAMTRIADLVLTPLAGLPPVAVILGLAFGTALAVLAAMRFTSNQAALAAVKRRIHAALLEMRLYNDDLRALLRAQGEVLKHNLAYVGHSLVPLVITAIPLTLVIAQLQAWYGYTGVPPGVPTTVTVEWSNGTTNRELPRLDAMSVDVIGTPRYFPTLKQAVWHIVPREPGAADLRLTLPTDGVATKTLHVGNDTARRSPFRDRGGFVSQLLYPSEPPLEPSSSIAAITVDYGNRSLSVAGVEMHWLIVYIVATFAFVLLLRRPLGVVI